MNFDSNLSETTKKRKRKSTIIKISITAMVIIILGAILFSQSSRRFFKSLQSNYTGGLDRTVTVYDDNGKVLKEWSGKIDIEENSYGNKVLFDLDGKRKTVYNAIVIVEEE